MTEPVVDRVEAPMREEHGLRVSIAARPRCCRFPAFRQRGVPKSWIARDGSDGAGGEP